ncbi:hypothetical protein CYMTET_4140 [Cymbomonas tetramitiformis]|uniref:Uncharacterized protein n=1 Tax=Cymbomonas tetramitiformis TaxID=36881 RepID=A0AAE0H1W5_9CHLO|nr:hypothetical protein CYMTET_4140 [Cymbomonas tetramitiformis]
MKLYVYELKQAHLHTLLATAMELLATATPCRTPYIIVSSVKSVLIPPALKLASMAWSTMMTVETPFPAAHHLDIQLYARRPPGLEIKAGIEDIHTNVSSMKLYVYELKQAYLQGLAVPTEVEALTEVLIEAELFTVDVAGALALGPWPVGAGTWAARKVIEAERFGAVSEWARSILALRVPVPTTAAPGAVAGGAGASGSGGAAPSGALTAPTAAAGGGSGAGAPAGGGPGGGVPAGAAGAQGTLGAGTIASAIAAPGVGASALTTSITATTVGTGTTMGSAAGGGPGGGVPAGAAGAQGALGVGTVASAAAAPSAGTHAMDPQSIAAAIAAAVGAKLDALGERLATLEAQRSAAGGAPTALSGTEPAEAAELRCAIRDSVATTEGWDMPRCVQACADLVQEAAKLRPQLTALRNVHPFGKTPMRTLEAHAFEPLAYILPELRAEECELDELPPGSEATLKHWRAFVHLLQARVGEFQRFVKS